MQKLRSLFGNTLGLVLLLALGVGAVLLLSSRAVQPLTGQPPATSIQLAGQPPSETPTPVTSTEVLTTTRTPVVIPVIITTFPTPTPAPSLTPTPTFEPLSDEPIMGFVFKPPQEVPNTRHPDGFDIVDWLPGSSEEILIKGAYTLETVNIFSETVELLATTKSPGDISEQPVWLPKAQGVAYLAWDSGKRHLWLGQEGGKKELLLPNVDPPLVPLGKGQGIAAYSNNDRAMKGISPNKRQLDTLPPVFDRLPRSDPGPPGTVHRIATQPKGDWIAYYNMEGFQIFNPQTDEIRKIDLGSNEFPPLWALDAKWSPDGQKLALIVVQGNLPISFSDLYILEWPSTTLHKVDDKFTFVTDIAWAPDSQHLLLGAVIDRDKYGVNITALYITNALTSSEILPVPIPIDGLGINFGGGLTWSPDGTQVLVKYFNDLGGALYKIEVIIQ